MNNETIQQSAKAFYQQCHDWYEQGLLTIKESLDLYESRWWELYEQEIKAGQGRQVAAK